MARTGAERARVVTDEAKAQAGKVLTDLQERAREQADGQVLAAQGCCGSGPTI